MLGFLGVGHLSAALLAGLVRAGHAPERILLSPRGRAAELAARHGFGLARDNADLVTRARLVVLAVRPADAPGAVRGLPWQADQLVISACAGVPMAALEVGPARLMRIMPVTAAEVGASPTACFPDLEEAREVLEAFGPVVPLTSEAEFQLATVTSAVYGWVQDLVRQTADWSVAQGLDPAVARRLNALMFSAAGALVAGKPQPMDQMLHELVTPGGITERGLQVLAQGGVAEQWRAACDAVLAKLEGAGTLRG